MLAAVTTAAAQEPLVLGDDRTIEISVEQGAADVQDIAADTDTWSEVLELVPCRGRVHGDLAASLPLSFLQGESEQMIGYVVFIGGVELHAKVGQSL